MNNLKSVASIANTSPEASRFAAESNLTTLLPKSAAVIGYESNLKIIGTTSPAFVKNCGSLGSSGSSGAASTGAVFVTTPIALIVLEPT